MSSAICLNLDQSKILSSGNRLISTVRKKPLFSNKRYSKRIVFLIAGLFLVAYYVLVVLICIPVAYVQIKLGALFKRGIVGIFSILVPILKGKTSVGLIYVYLA